MILRILNLLLRYTASFIVIGLTLLALTWLPGFEIQGIGSALIAIGVLSFLNAHLYPLMVRVALPLTVISFGLVGLIMNGVVVMIASAIVPGLIVSDLGTGILISLVVTFLFDILVPAILANRESDLYRFEVVKRFANRQRKAAAVAYDRPGLMIIEIDGLSLPTLRRAVQQGAMPHLSRLLRSGDYHLHSFDSGLPSMTSSMQAGLLHGSHVDIPSFRFYDKSLKRVLVSNRPKDAAIMLSRVDNGEGILASNGFSLNNWAHGNAQEVLLTFSGFATETGSLRASMRSDTVFQFFAEAYNVQRVIFASIADIYRERREAAWQRSRDVQPRVERKFPYPLLRAGTTVVLPYISVYLLVGKMFEGISVAYTTFVGYDEVAHHSGVERSDAFRILKQLDDQIRILMDASRSTPRPYEFVLLADHGQSQGATFLQRYGLTLADLIRSLMTTGSHHVQAVAGDESSSNVNLLASELVHSSRWLAGRMKEALKSRTDDDFVELVDSESFDEADAAEGADAVVCVSGNFANVYFTQADERLTFEQIELLHPGLIARLAEHPGIGFVMVHSALDGPVVIGDRGVHFLREDRIEGKSPLAPFDSTAARHLIELDTYRTVGDLVINSMYDPEWDEVAAFEELVGSHGGIGGDQTHPFLMYPVSFDPDHAIGELIGVEAVYRLLKQWAEGR